MENDFELLKMPLKSQIEAFQGLVNSGEIWNRSGFIKTRAKYHIGRGEIKLPEGREKWGKEITYDLY